ncbi:hypothetical protein evm_010678 [Chilo suppressalis]|nr:hypothetical protein evm_010678 [Chilo suppressalis]
MYKLLSFVVCLAVAFAAPAPEPSGALATIAYKAPLTYIPQAPLGYAAVPSAPIAYSPQLAYSAYSYPSYAAPIAYSKLY